ncbi:hypothetical protein DFH09DRAFT_1355655 [Mycena vulgaris]|nr:hypothetical protein DFH09DRAFT_1355655 [Mycena vulgaris]
MSQTAVLPARIPLTDMPLLQSFEGPLKLLGLFIPGHCYVHPRLCFPHEITSARNDIAQSSAAPLIELHPRAAGSSELFAALTEGVSELRQLSLELNEPSRFWPPLVAVNPSFRSESEEEAELDELDERTVELSDDGTLELMESEVSDGYDDEDNDAVELLTDVQTRYMYGRSGEVFPPPPDATADENPERFPSVMASMCTGRVALPEHLEQPRSWKFAAALELTDQHRALLRLGALDDVDMSQKPNFGYNLG